MQRRALLIVPVLMVLFFCRAGAAVESIMTSGAEKGAAGAAKAPAGLSACERARGRLIKITECDGSLSDWCVLSEKEQCYADQVKDGACTAGEYSQEVQGIVGISPRVLCDTPDTQ